MSPHSSAGRVLIVDDEGDIRALLSRLIRQEGYEPLEAATGEEALTTIRYETPDVVLLDIRMPGLDGMEVLRQVKRLEPTLPVVMITCNGVAKDAVAALRAGAQDYLVKPFDHADVIRALHSAMANGGLSRTIRALSERTQECARLHEMMGPSEAVSRICRDVARVASSDFTVLIIGETGSGKEIVAQAIHDASPRVDAPFVAVDCGAIPETLFESELFGHEKGAFTGADRSRPGKFELASAGTLFFDEILNMPLGSQAKLLRALQERRIHHVGGAKPIAVDVRVLVAANENLEQASTRGTLRKDLLFRLNEFVIRIPPLRERKEDIAFLAKRFLDDTNLELGKAVKGFSQDAMERLQVLEWPGNVRELRGTIRRAVLLADTGIDLEHLGFSEKLHPSAADTAPSSVAGNGMALRQLVHGALVAVERDALLRTLTQTEWNRAKAARLLQIDYKTMRTKLKAYGLTPPRER